MKYCEKFYHSALQFSWLRQTREKGPVSDLPNSTQHYIFKVDNYHKTIKGEIQNRFNLNSEERVKLFEQNTENLIKISCKIRKLWLFEVSQIFKKHFLTSRYEYANEWVDDVIASQFSIHFVHRNDKHLVFQLWEC